VTDRSDAVVVTYRADGGARRLRFEPRSDGRHDLVEETLTNGGTWRVVGERVVDSVAVDA